MHFYSGPPMHVPSGVDTRHHHFVVGSSALRIEIGPFMLSGRNSTTAVAFSHSKSLRNASDTEASRSSSLVRAQSVNAIGLNPCRRPSATFAQNPGAATEVSDNRA